MKIITDKGEYVFQYEDDAIIYADPPRVQVELTNVQTGVKVTLDIAFYELKAMAEHLCEQVQCGICNKKLWHHDDGRWHHEVGHMCTPCAETSDHPAAQFHRAIKEGLEERLKQEKKERDGEPS